MMTHFDLFRFHSWVFKSEPNLRTQAIAPNLRVADGFLRIPDNLILHTTFFVTPETKERYVEIWFTTKCPLFQVIQICSNLIKRLTGNGNSNFPRAQL